MLQEVDEGGNRARRLQPRGEDAGGNDEADHGGVTGTAALKERLGEFAGVHEGDERHADDTDQHRSDDVHARFREPDGCDHQDGERNERDERLDVIHLEFSGFLDFDLAGFIRRLVILVFDDHQHGIDEDGKENKPHDVGRGIDDEVHHAHVGDLRDEDVVRAARVEDEACHRAAPDRRGGCRRTDAGAQEKRNEGGACGGGGTGGTHDGDVDREGENRRGGNQKTAQFL